jgi:kynurenine formamidase
MFAMLQSRWLIIPILITGALGVVVCTSAQEHWFPSRWGADDERGAMNLLTPAKVLEAVSLVKTGQVYQLGRVYERGMPLYGERQFNMYIPASTTAAGVGTNRLTYHEEVLTTEIGQVGTQFDGLGHIGIGDLFYNGLDRREFATPYGLDKLGVENVGVFVTRGVLLDVAAYKNVAILPDNYEITVEDITGTLAREQVDIREGDVVIFHTGWGSLWMVDNDRYNAGEPGPGIAAARWLADKGMVMAGADSWSVEVMPNPNPDLANPVHQEWITKRGIHNLENLDTAALARDAVYEFMFVFSPLRLKGGTGSPGNPIAIR